VRTSKQIAVGIGLPRNQDANWWQVAHGSHASLAPAQVAVVLQLAQHLLQLDPARALDAEGPRNFALARRPGVLPNPIENFVLGRETVHWLAISCGLRGVMGKAQRPRISVKNASISKVAEMSMLVLPSSFSTQRRFLFPAQVCPPPSIMNCRKGAAHPR